MQAAIERRWHRLGAVPKDARMLLGPNLELAGRTRRAITSIIEPHQVCPPTPTLSPKLT